MKLAYLFGGMLVAGATALITQTVLEDTLGSAYDNAKEAAQSDSFVRSAIGSSTIGLVGSAIGVKGLSWAVKKVRGI